MKPTPYGRPATTSPLPRLLLMAGMLAVGGVGTIVLLVAGGVVDLPFLHKAEKPKPQGVPVPLSARAIPAHTQLLRDHIMDAKTLELTLAYYPPEAVEKYGLLTLDQFLDHLRDHRVLAKDIPAGSAFDETCFLPVGTKPGVVAGVPVGKVSYVLDAQKVAGVAELKIGDHIDVLAPAVREFDAATQRYRTTPLPHGKADAGAADAKTGGLEMVVALAKDAVVVEPLTTREVPDETAVIPQQTGKPRMRATQDVTIAVDPKEATALGEAAAVQANIYCVAHTGLPNDPDAQAKPDGVPVPLAARPIPAYTRVARDHVLDARTLDLALEYHSPEDVKKNGYLAIDKVLGRVLARDKPAGYPFTDKDFLPDDAPAAMTAGVPPGKRSFVLEAEQVEGAKDLKIGDHVDVLAAVMFEFDRNTLRYHTVPLAHFKAGEKPPDYKPGQQGTVVALAQDAVVIQPLTAREAPADAPGVSLRLEGSGLSLTGEAKARVWQDITLAIDPKEAASLAEAAAVDAEFFCVAHTGLSNDVPGVTPGLLAPPPVQTVESVVGGKHEVKIFAGPNGLSPSWSPAPQPPDNNAPPSPPAARPKVADDGKSDTATEAAKDGGQ